MLNLIHILMMKLFEALAWKEIWVKIEQRWDLYYICWFYCCYILLRNDTHACLRPNTSSGMKLLNYVFTKNSQVRERIWKGKRIRFFTEKIPFLAFERKDTKRWNSTCMEMKNPTHEVENAVTSFKWKKWKRKKVLTFILKSFKLKVCFIITGRLHWLTHCSIWTNI